MRFTQCEGATFRKDSDSQELMLVGNPTHQGRNSSTTAETIIRTVKAASDFFHAGVNQRTLVTVDS